MIHIVPQDQIKDYWERVEPLLEPAFQMGGRAKSDDVLKWLERGTYQLWVVEGDRVSAAATTAVSEYPSVQMLTIVHLGGRGIWEWIWDGMDRLVEYASDKGCDGIEVIGREEWGRVLPGFDRRAILAERWIQ
jgi:hypothetical protein